MAKIELESSHSLAAGEFPSSPFYSVSTEPKSFPLIVEGALVCSTPNIHADGRLDTWQVILGTVLEAECNNLREIQRGIRPWYYSLWLPYVVRPGGKK